VILLSGTDDADIAEHARSAGASAFLVKFALEELLETIRRVCAQ
jgi:DNA-binding NarL/FixJ family response regulator